MVAEIASDHGLGTCTFYGTANSNQMLIDFMGQHLPEASFVPPNSDLHSALNAQWITQVISNTQRGAEQGLPSKNSFPLMRQALRLHWDHWQVLCHITFYPTGGIPPKNAKIYLAVPNIVCVGGSWIAPKALIAAEAWDEITKIARRAAYLLR